jgi:hypothetical protein
MIIIIKKYLIFKKNHFIVCLQINFFGMQIIIFIYLWIFLARFLQNVDFFFWYQPSLCINVVPSKCARIWIPSVKDLSKSSLKMSKSYMKKILKIVSSFFLPFSNTSHNTNLLGTSRMKATMCHQFEMLIGGTCSTSSSSSRKARKLTNVVCAMCNALLLLRWYCGLKFMYNTCF